MAEYTPAQIRTGNRRLLKLADILDVADALHRKRKEPTYSQLDVEHGCGTPACAYGHAVANRDLRRAGIPSYSDWNRREEFFAVAATEFYDIFGGDGCNGARTAKQAARYIRTFAKRRERALASATPTAVRA
jgi:hypothetical protein